MKKTEVSSAIFIVALLAIAGFVWFSPGGLQAAPDVAMQTLQQQKISIKQLQGKPAIVVFWSTTCPGCIKEMPHLAELYHDLHSKGLEIIGVAMEYDEPAQVEKLVQLRKIPYTISYDQGGAVAKAFGDVKLTPTTFLINPEGKIVHIWPKVKVKGHVDDVLQTLMQSKND